MHRPMAYCQVIEVGVLFTTLFLWPGRDGEFCFDLTRSVSPFGKAGIAFIFPVVVRGNDQIRIGIGFTYQLGDDFQIVAVKGDVDAVPGGFMNRCTGAEALSDDSGWCGVTEGMPQA